MSMYRAVEIRLSYRSAIDGPSLDSIWIGHLLTNIAAALLLGAFQKRFWALKYKIS